MATMGPTTTRHAERMAGNLVRLARRRVGVTQREMAARAGVPQSTVARIETYQVQPSLLTLSKLLAAIGLEPRVHIEEYDDHDDGLDTQSAAMTPQQRAAREIAQDAFSVALRAGRPVK